MGKMMLALTRAEDDDEEIGLKAGDPFFRGAGLIATYDRTTRIMTLHEVSPILGAVVTEVELQPSDVALANIATMFGAAPAPKPAGGTMPDHWRGEGWMARLASGTTPGLEVSEDVPAPGDVLASAFGHAGG